MSDESQNAIVLHIPGSRRPSSVFLYILFSDQTDQSWTLFLKSSFAANSSWNHDSIRWIRFGNQVQGGTPHKVKIFLWSSASKLGIHFQIFFIQGLQPGYSKPLSRGGLSRFYHLSSAFLRHRAVWPRKRAVDIQRVLFAELGNQCPLMNLSFSKGHPNALQHCLDHILTIAGSRILSSHGAFIFIQVCVQVHKQNCYLTSCFQEVCDLRHGHKVSHMAKHL